MVSKQEGKTYAKGKGSNYEREICKKLSKWWSHGVRDDLFWRSQASGGRATIRGRIGQKTKGAYGDITNTCPESEPLLKVCTIEVKRGYSKKTSSSIMTLLESKGNKQLIKQFWKQTLDSCNLAKADGFGSNPILIIKRDNRNPCLYISTRLFNQIIDFCGRFPKSETKIQFNIGQDEITVMKLDTFLNWVDPTFFEFEVKHGGKKLHRM